MNAAPAVRARRARYKSRAPLKRLREPRAHNNIGRPICTTILQSHICAHGHSRPICMCMYRATGFAQITVALILQRPSKALQIAMRTSRWVPMLRLLRSHSNFCSTRLEFGRIGPMLVDHDSILVGSNCGRAQPELGKFGELGHIIWSNATQKFGP